MKRLVRFHKAFLPAAIVSAALVLFSVLGLATQGFNLGVDFQAGVNKYVQLAFPVGSMSYAGGTTARLAIGDAEMSIVFTGDDAQSRTARWNLSTVGTIADLARALEAEGVQFAVRDGAGLAAALLVPTYQGDFVLSAAAVPVHRRARDANEVFGSVEEIRAAVGSVGSVAVQNVGGRASMQYVIRVGDDGSNPSFGSVVPSAIDRALEAAFGAGRVVTMRTDFVGARFSKDLANNSWKLFLMTLAVIMIYASVRFKVQFAAGAVLAIVHDVAIMIGFIVWTRMEFNTTSIAAILTILGYSINDTIVIFDRIREDHKLNPTDKMTTIIDKSITETLGRTIITTLTTLLAVFALYFFTSGSIKDFALALVVGMISGTYSTIFIASGFVGLWDSVAAKRRARLEGQAPATAAR